MSAYVVDRQHIMYLVKAAASRQLNHGSDFRWTHNGKTHKLSGLVDGQEEEIRIANILWRENVKSVMYRYPDDTEDSLPGPIGETYWITIDDLNMLWTVLKPVQVIKSCHCYAYQSCEHEEWETSEAKAFVDRLIARETRRIPGYDDCQWGAPEPYANRVLRLV